MLISPEYREQNKKLHEDPSFGFTGRKFAGEVYEICEKVGSMDILDYGCGKRTLEKTLGFAIKNYDPAIEGLDSPPEPADVVACIDVLEHIEPECLEDVLDDIQRCTKKAALLCIANRPAKKTLPDGRNAHLIQEGPEWWLPKIFKRWNLVRFTEMTKNDKPVGFGIIVRTKIGDVRTSY